MIKFDIVTAFMSIHLTQLNSDALAVGVRMLLVKNEIV